MPDLQSTIAEPDFDSLCPLLIDNHVLLAIADGSGFSDHLSQAARALLGENPLIPFTAEIKDRLQRGESWQGELQVFDREGVGHGLIARILPLSGGSHFLVMAFDVTEVIKEERLYQDVLAEFPEPLVRLDGRGCIVFANAAFGSLLGRNLGEMSGTAIVDLVEETDRAIALAALIKAQTAPHRAQVEIRVRAAGRVHWSAWDVFAAVGEGGESQLFVLWRDISCAKLQEAAGAASEERYRALLEHASDAIFLADPEGHLLEMNRRALEWLGYVSEEIPNLTTRNLYPLGEWNRWDAAVQEMQGHGAVLCEISMLRKDGVAQPVEISATLIEYRGRKLTLGIFRDLALRRQAERERLYHLAFYDGLTQLPNRELFYERLYQSLAESRGTGELLGLLFIDLDRFKNVNETLGHSVGDQLLAGVAERLRRCAQAKDILARTGGDEFMVILPKLERAEEAERVAIHIINELARPFVAGTAQLFVTVSIGIALSPRDGGDPESLMKNTETAMYRAKESHHSSFEFYRPEMSARFFERLSLEQDLRRALQREELQLVYQPQIDIRSGALAGVEALVRWQHRRLGPLSPGLFIGLAEEVGLIDEIGEWVLRTAARQTCDWAGSFGRCRLAVNLSTCQLRYRDFMQRVERVLQETGIAPSSLELELTESVLMQDTDRMVDLLRGLADLGVRIAIDDFGTGYSSLSYLKRFAIHKLKIDRAFVRDIPANSNDVALTGAIIAMAHALQMQVIAEGVETDAQYRFLRDQGCDEMQGFLLGAPLTAQELICMGNASGKDWRPAGV